MPLTAKEIMTKFFNAEREVTASANPTVEQKMAVITCFSPDIVLEQSPDLPYGGVYRGREEFTKFFGIFSELFDSVDVHPNNIFEDGDQVIVYADVTIKARKNQVVRVVPMVQVVTVDREAGNITHVKPFYWNVAGLNAMLKEQTTRV